MRKKGFLFLFLLGYSFSAFADEEVPVLEVQLQRHHSQQWTKIFKTKDGWHCSSEHNPAFTLEKRPKALDLFQEGKNATRGCNDFFRARLEEHGKRKVWEGCSNDSAELRFLKVLGKECGRF